MKGLGIFAWIAISALVSALLDSWAMATLWRWFAAAQYGPGPSLGAWFGLATIASLALQSGPDFKSAADTPWSEVVKKTIMAWLLVLLALGIAWCVGAVVGWIR